MPIGNKKCRLGEKCRLEQNMPIGTKYADWNDVCLRAYVCVRVCVHVHAHRFPIEVLAEPRKSKK